MLITFFTFVDVYPVDLRWGVTATMPDQQVEACLNEVEKCDIFIGVLGQRYGWKPEIKPNSRSMQKVNYSFTSRNQLFVYIFFILADV